MSALLFVTEMKRIADMSEIKMGVVFKESMKILRSQQTPLFSFQTSLTLCFWRFPFLSFRQILNEPSNRKEDPRIYILEELAVG